MGAFTLAGLPGLAWILPTPRDGGLAQWNRLNPEPGGGFRRGFRRTRFRQMCFGWIGVTTEDRSSCGVRLLISMSATG
ncbi:hypothetical protein Ga0074812_106217 [Parafrankia irregularis]|uniref:Uncharacterized protein n=1 Tax=Parafrankia irregularis TaxID=795642 RepID=A0A0S4QNA4_9ACTN|nr:hypothetical protein Ga0074812_106217 [Parafrankia irregularis]